MSTKGWSRPIILVLFTAVFFVFDPVRVHAAVRLVVGTPIDSTQVKELGLFPGEVIEHIRLFRDPAKLKWYKLTVQHTPAEIDTLRIHQTLLDELNTLLDQRAAGDQSGILCEFEVERMEAVSGRLVEWDGRAVTMLTPYGNLHIPVGDVKRVTPMFRGKTDGENIIREDPNTTRLFFAPTARSLPKGQGYFSVYEVVFPNVNYSVGSNITLGGGIFPMISADFFMGWITPKVGLYETDGFSLASGILAAAANGGGESNGFGVIYSVGTLGDPDASVTLGLGYGYANGDWTKKPVVMLGGEYRIGRNTKLISENWAPPYDASDPEAIKLAYSLGVRWFWRRISADFAMIRTDSIPFLGIPWVDFVVNF